MVSARLASTRLQTFPLDNGQSMAMPQKRFFKGFTDNKYYLRQSAICQEQNGNETSHGSSLGTKKLKSE